MTARMNTPAPPPTPVSEADDFAFWLKDAASILRQNGSDTHAEWVKRAAARLDTATPSAADEAAIMDGAGPQGEPIRFGYTNYRGEHGMRYVLPMSVHWGVTDYHPVPCWLLTGFDRDKAAVRLFALADCDFTSTPPAQDLAREEVARIIESEVATYRAAQDAATTDSDKLYRMGQKDALIHIAREIDAILSGSGRS